MSRFFLATTLVLMLSACGNLEKRVISINPGDTREQVVAAMGAPEDRQFRDAEEAWQYCQTGAGFGYHDHRVIWFRNGKVTGITSVKSTRPGTSCVAGIKSIRWEEAPDYVLEMRQR